MVNHRFEFHVDKHDPRNKNPRFRQAARLDPSELERLAQLNPAEREAYVVPVSPARPSRSG